MCLCFYGFSWSDKKCEKAKKEEREEKFLGARPARRERMVNIDEEGKTSDREKKKPIEEEKEEKRNRVFD